MNEVVENLLNEYELMWHRGELDNDYNEFVEENYDWLLSLSDEEVEEEFYRTWIDEQLKALA